MTTDAKPTCELCGEPMPPGEEMFKFHGYSGPCPKPPLPAPSDELEPALAAGIRAIMRREWSDNDPSPDCFDYSKEQRRRVVAWVEGSADEALRQHLIGCSRCRLIFCAVREPKVTPPESRDTPPRQQQRRFGLWLLGYLRERTPKLPDQSFYDVNDMEAAWDAAIALTDGAAGGAAGATTAAAQEKP